MILWNFLFISISIQPSRLLLKNGENCHNCLNVDVIVVTNKSATFLKSDKWSRNFLSTAMFCWSPCIYKTPVSIKNIFISVPKAVRSKIEKIPETASDISPYATSNLQTLPAGGRQHTLGRTETLTPGGRQHTLGRNETLRLSDYHRQMETMGRDTLGRQKDRDTLGQQIDRDTIGRQIDRDTLGRHRHQQQQQQQVQQQVLELASLF